MDVWLLLEIANRDMPGEARRLLTLGGHQLALAETALELHQETSGDFTAANLAGPGIASVSGGFAAFANTRPRNAHEVMALATAMLRPSRRSELGARTFVYELAVLRRAAVAVGKLTPCPDEARALIARFDASCPTLVKLRDTLAHMDERFIGEARRVAIAVQPAMVGNEALEPGLSVAPGSLSGHLADGSFGRVEISGVVRDAAKALLIDLTRLFPLLPGAPDSLRTSTASPGSGGAE